MRGGGNELLLLDNTGVDHAGNQGFAEFSRADYGNFCLRKHAVPFQ